MLPTALTLLDLSFPNLQVQAGDAYTFGGP